MGTIIETQRERCIQWTRCMRSGSEVAGIQELEGRGRGEDMERRT